MHTAAAAASGSNSSNSVLILAILMGFYLLRIGYLILVKQASYTHLLISLYIASVVLNYGYYFTELPYLGPTGVFTLRVGIEPYDLLIIFYLVFGKKLQLKLGVNVLVTCLCLLIVFAMSYINPLDTSKSATILGAFYLCKFIFFSFLVVKTNTVEDIFRGIWDAFIVMGAVNLVLVIMFPILGMVSVTKIFKGEFVETRQERTGGVGTFSHPNVLGNYMTYNVAFFLSCYLNGYKKQLSMLFLVASFFVLFTTGSRSGLLGGFVMAVFVFSIYKRPNKPVLAPGLVFKIIVPALVLVAILVFFTPLGSLRTNENLKQMSLARNAHYRIGWRIFRESPVIGVGFNSHIQYIRHHYSDLDVVDLSTDFAQNNPIHNVFLIVACETGVIGMIMFTLYMYRQFMFSKRALSTYGQDVRSKILQLTSIGCIIAMCVHGLSDWAPFNQQMLHIWLFIVIIATMLRANNTKLQTVKLVLQ